jgi:hypothetical protein
MLAHDQGRLEKATEVYEWYGYTEKATEVSMNAMVALKNLTSSKWQT